MNRIGAISWLVGCVCLLAPVLRAEPPVAVGTPVPDLARFDTLMQQFMMTNDIPAGALGIMHDSTVVFDRAYGHADEARIHPVRPDVVMRVASLTKPVTAAAIRKLIAAGSLSLTDKVFSLGVPGSGVLDYVPFGSPDARLGDITIDHLLRHRGGWDRDAVGDLTYMERTIAAAMNVDSPPSRVDTVRYIMGQPLQSDPGSTYHYSNIGFLILGLIVEQVSGLDYESYVHQQVFAGTDITREQLFLGRTFKQDQDEREPHYHRTALAWNVYYPVASTEQFVPWPYGGWNHEARTGQGRIVASTRAYLAYLDRYMVNGDAIGMPRWSPGNWRWNHTGSLSGSNALARQRGDGINYVVLFNQRPGSGSSYASRMRTLIDQVLDNETITWPTTDPDSTPLTMPMVSIDFTADQMAIPTRSGRYYQIELSYDLDRWIDHSAPPIIGTGLEHAVMELTAAETNSPVFYRVRVR